MYNKASDRTGSLIPQRFESHNFLSFVPKELPPCPPLMSDIDLEKLKEQAALALAKLDGSMIHIPNPELFMYMYVKKEAALSAQIEGTKATLTDLLEHEAELEVKSSLDDVEEISNYVKAMNHGLSSLEQRPLSLNLIKEIHKILLEGVRGHNKRRGEFRSGPAWIGSIHIKDAEYVAPPADIAIEAMGKLEEFIHDPNYPALIKTGLIHAHFETIHPFMDGNGRVGRILIPLILCSEGCLSRPLLYISLYFRKEKTEYCKRLQAIREDGDWEGWMKFYLKGVREVSYQALETALRIIELQKEHRQIIESWGRAAGSALQILNLLFERGYIRATDASKITGISEPTCRKVLERFEEQNWVTEVSKRDWGKAYRYDPYVEIILDGIS